MDDHAAAVSGTPVRPDRCPLCGGPNACGAAAGRASCWCVDARLPAAVLDRVPAGARDVACVCQACAGQGASSPVARGGAARPADTP